MPSPEVASPAGMYEAERADVHRRGAQVLQKGDAQKATAGQPRRVAGVTGWGSELQ